MSVTRRDVQEIRMLTVLMLKISRQHLEQCFAEKEIDLTMLQHHVMVMAKHHQPTIAEMSRTFGLDPSTLVPTVDGLVKKGYLRRERDSQDRRRYPLYLTEAGEALHQRIRHELEDDPLQHILEGFAEDEVMQLRGYLRRIVGALPDGDSALSELDAHIDKYELPETKNPY